MSTRPSIKYRCVAVFLLTGYLYGTTASQPPLPPYSLGILCSNSCYTAWADDGFCDDGGPGSTLPLCAYGTDCTDCGLRSSSGAPSPPPPNPPPSPPIPPFSPGGALCSNTCSWEDFDGSPISAAGDGLCDDGGPGSLYTSTCEYGTDCTDCGIRDASGAPPTPPPPNVFTTTAGVVLGIVLIVSLVLVGVVSAFYTKLSSGSTRFTFEQLHQWEVETGGKHWCQRYRVKASRLLIQWLCIENTFALSVEVTNAMAAASDDPLVPFALATVINGFMVALELWEYCRMRQGVERSRLDSFLFGDWDSTPRSVWAKYAERISLLNQLLFNIAGWLIYATLPLVQPQGYIDRFGDSGGNAQLLAAGAAGMTSYVSEVKNAAGLLSLGEILGFPLLVNWIFDWLQPRIEDGLTQATNIKKRVPEWVRIGPLASPDAYRARDFLLSNLTIYLSAFLYACLIFKRKVCEPFGGVGSASAQSEGLCRNAPESLFEFTKAPSVAIPVYAISVFVVLIVICTARCKVTGRVFVPSTSTDHRGISSPAEQSSVTTFAA